jgi:hypothetical protein
LFFLFSIVHGDPLDAPLLLFRTFCNSSLVFFLGFYFFFSITPKAYWNIYMNNLSKTNVELEVSFLSSCFPPTYIFVGRSPKWGQKRANLTI